MLRLGSPQLGTLFRLRPVRLVGRAVSFPPLPVPASAVGTGAAATMPPSAGTAKSQTRHHGGSQLGAPALGRVQCAALGPGRVLDAVRRRTGVLGLAFLVL